MSSDYRPVSCDFHDVLEALATRREPVDIRFRDANGVVQRRRAAIAELVTRGGAEYMLISPGETIRLDRVLAAAASSEAPI